MGGYCQLSGFFVYRHLRGVLVRTYTLLCNNRSPKKGTMKKILSIFAIYGILSNVNAQGWSESFNNVSGLLLIGVHWPVTWFGWSGTKGLLVLFYSIWMVIVGLPF